MTHPGTSGGRSLDPVAGIPAPGPARLVSLSIIVLGAAAPAVADNPVQARHVTLEAEQQLPMLPDDVEDDVAAGEQPGATRSGEFVIAPLPSRSPLLGWALAVPAMYLYRPRGVSADRPAWITGATGLYTEDGGWGAGLFHRMNFRDDRWRFMGAAAYGDLDYRFFGIGGNPDTSIPINQVIELVSIEGMVRVADNVYAGLRVVDSHSEVRLALNTGALPPGFELPDISIDVDLSTLAPRIEYDTRDNEFYPASGKLAAASVSLGRDWLGSDQEFEKYQLSINDYRPVSERGVLATRLAAQYLSGDAPFFIYPAFGSGADLRGYDTGAYRDRFLFAAQTEFRFRWRERIGFAAFAGIGTSASGFAEWDESLWAIGAGVRWVVAPKNDFSLRFDVAQGRDDTQFYLGLGEAF